MRGAFKVISESRARFERRTFARAIDDRSSTPGSTDFLRHHAEKERENETSVRLLERLVEKTVNDDADKAPEQTSLFPPQVACHKEKQCDVADEPDEAGPEENVDILVMRRSGESQDPHAQIAGTRQRVALQKFEHAADDEQPGPRRPFIREVVTDRARVEHERDEPRLEEAERKRNQHIKDDEQGAHSNDYTGAFRETAKRWAFQPCPQRRQRIQASTCNQRD